MSLFWNRIEPGTYRSSDGRLVVTREVKKEMYYRGRKQHYKVVVEWAIAIDGKETGFAEATLSEAKASAIRKLQQRSKAHGIDTTR